MVEPAFGPFLFDTSAESWLTRNQDPAVVAWTHHYLTLHQIRISAVTVMERIRGYSVLWRRAEPHRKQNIEDARIVYLSRLGLVLPFDNASAVVAAEIMALIPEPPTPPLSKRRIPHRAFGPMAI
jgi:predicted nucleic acid-binding protein